jgi:hypothetical protein
VKSSFCACHDGGDLQSRNILSVEGFFKKIGDIEGLRIIRVEQIWIIREGPIRTSLLFWLNHFTSCRKYRRYFHESSVYLTDSLFIISLMSVKFSKTLWFSLIFSRCVILSNQYVQCCEPARCPFFGSEGYRPHGDIPIILAIG